MSALIYTKNGHPQNRIYYFKNWQALPVSATTGNVPNVEDQARPPSPRGLPDNVQWPTAHLSSKPDIVELHEINRDEPNEPRAVNI